MTRLFERLDRLTGEVASSAEAMQPSAIPAIAAKAAAAQPAWGALGSLDEAVKAGLGLWPVWWQVGIDSFTETRWITIETQPGHFPILSHPTKRMDDRQRISLPTTRPDQGAFGTTRNPARQIGFAGRDDGAVMCVGAGPW